MRRLAGALIGLVVLAGVAVVPVLPSAAGDVGPAKEQWDIRIVSVLCNPATGRWQSTFGLRNANQYQSITFTSAILQDSGVDIVGSFSPNPFPSGQWTYGVVTQPGDASTPGSDPPRFESETMSIDYVADGTSLGIRTPSWAWSSDPCTMTAALAVSHTVVAPGTTVTISGTGCIRPLAPVNQGVAVTAGSDVEIVPSGASPPANAAAITGTVTGSVAFAPPVSFGPITAAGDGSWSTTIVVPAGTPAGTYPVSATCSYPEIPLRQGALDVSTTSFAYPAGKALTIPVAARPKFAG